MVTQILLPPGRIVEGNVYKSSNVGLNGQIKPKPEFYFAVAIAKSEPRLGEVFAAYINEARTGFAAVQQILGRIGQQINFNNGFAWKIADGDAQDRRERSGQAGCWIFKIKTTWDVRVVDAQNLPIAPALLRTGFWCDVLVNLAPNGKTDHTAGLYVNPVFARWLFPGYGEEIFPGPQASVVMGAAPSQLPPGAQPASHPGGAGGPAPGVGGLYPQSAASGAPGVGYQAPPPAQAAPEGWQGNPSMSGGYGQQPAAQVLPVTAPGNSPGPSQYNPTQQPPAHASGPAAQASAVPGGAHYTPAGPGSPTASPSSAPPIAGFAHGNPSPGS